MNKLAILFGLTFLAFGLITVKGQTKIHIPEPYGDNFIESELIREVSYVVLELERYGTIMPDMEMRVDDENYFILDNKTTQCVYRFNNDGILLNTICEQKKQSKENTPDLSNPIKFNIDPNLNQVELYNFENSSITRFDYGGASKSTISFQFNPSDFIRNNDGEYWIYTGWNNSETPFRLLKTDQNGKIIDRRLRLTTRCTQTEGYAFYPLKNKILFWELLGNTTYLIENNDVKPRYQFDFGNYNLPLDYHYIDPNESFPMINKAGYYSIKKYLENDNFAYFFINFTSIDKRDMFHVIHDLKSGQVHIYTENSGIGAFDKAQALTENNELIFLVSPRRMRQLMNNDTDYIPVAFAHVIEEMSTMRNPVVLRIKLESLSTAPIDEQYEYNEENYFND